MQTKHFCSYAIGIKLSIYIQQNWKVQLQKRMYNYKDKIYFSLYAWSLINQTEQI